ncbi:hypothetical protein BUALT_Bualt07G0008200 [Buddleja alternifolia]|uniref:Homeobox-leucine zipper protein n=1 Tax=Buddleja alternifolia TaxID=168488 RepID=A0AAV6X8A9_9LAMI|nr:hypothetical protein BUALT_Bualt07G0008200 [Buddleja alternifolia]
MAIRFEKYQIESLKMAFEESEYLTKEKKIELVRLTGLDMEQIASWYNRRRARKRAKESRGELERINKDLKQSVRERHEHEAKLQKELRDSKKREAELQDENQRFKHQLTIVEGVFVSDESPSGRGDSMMELRWIKVGHTSASNGL